MSELKENVRLKLIREEKGYTQEQFAEIMEMSVSGYKKLESGEVNLGIDKIHIINKKLGISADYILYDGKTELAEAWEKALRLPEQEKWQLFLRLHAYLVRNVQNDMLLDEAAAAFEDEITKLLNRKNNGE